MADRTCVRLPSRGAGLDNAAVLTALTGAYELGWQPADLIHLTRRSLGAAEVRLACWAIRHEARLTDAMARAPLTWADQLADLDSAPTATGSGSLGHATLSYLWRHLPRLPVECPPPSRWPHNPRLETTWPSGTDLRLPNGVRGLLTRAEHADYPEEAETCTAKAQELLTRHTVENTLRRLRAPHRNPIEIHSRRVHLTGPYLKEKVRLLSEIGRCNNVRTVWFSKLAMATIIGTPNTVDHVRLFFDSLLVQSNRAMHDAAQARPSPSSTAFRRTFHYGFAIRIGERLQRHRITAEKEAVGMSGAVWKRWKEQTESALDTRITELFCHTTNRKTWWDEETHTTTEEDQYQTA